MSIPGRAKAAPTPVYALCEPSGASTLSREHIRRVGPEGIKPGGGIPDNEHGIALCGHSVVHGWDIPQRPVEPQEFLPDAEVNPTCRGCIAALESETQNETDTPSETEGAAR